MDKRLQLIAHLYDEDVDGLEPLAHLLRDPELRAEYEVMSEARFGIERRPRARPDARLIDAIVAAAAHEGIQPARPDRSPLRLVRTPRFWVPALSAAAAILLFVMTWPAASPTVTPEEVTLAADEPAESLLRSLPPAPPVVEPVRAEAEPVPPSSSLDWDTGGDLRHLSRRIDRLRAAGIDLWDSPAVPLEALPTGSGTEGLLQTGARRRTP